MGLLIPSIVFFMQALVEAVQLQSAPPNSSWISHLRVLGDGCSSATAQVAPDSSSFTITWKLNQPDQALALAEVQAAGTRKLTCGAAFVLEMPPAQSNRSAIFLDSERSGTWQLQPGSRASIQSSMAGLSDLWPSEPQPIELSESEPFRVSSPIYASGANGAEGSVEYCQLEHRAIEW
ncbi:hypothetical protein KVR01_010633 [Diaporthe batatas]|uniref:uncharacterized protein n=1 Tax=Diaporthe batatas TaxID=748121 RepID=UPI001D045CEE|nr:uncharacterized protein KVR01_010633 [Diaporthe batatas]KAG8159996.1 hypothetical protein KVR01_010633 [Diaporthe batatas]